LRKRSGQACSSGVESRPLGLLRTSRSSAGTWLAILVRVDPGLVQLRRMPAAMALTDRPSVHAMTACLLKM
jgi:hypothetical protein